MGRWNELLAWWLVALGLLGGAVLGLWSFGEPLSSPAALSAYDALPRRLLRLSHIALVALPLLNLLYVQWLVRTGWSLRTRQALCRLLLFGTVGLPSSLAAAAFAPWALYLTPVPALAVIAAVFLLALGLALAAPGERRGT